jgi:hypothetical protein
MSAPHKVLHKLNNLILDQVQFTVSGWAITYLRGIHDRMIVVVCRRGCRVDEDKPADAESKLSDNLR